MLWLPVSILNYIYSIIIMYQSKVPNSLTKHTLTTANSKIFARILFSRISLKDIFATFKIRDMDMIHQRGDIR